MSPSDPSTKIGPPIGVRRLKRIKGTATSPGTIQPGQGVKKHHCAIKPAAPTGNHDTGPEAGSSIARRPTHKPCPWHPLQGLTEKEREEEYLNSFRSTTIFPLNSMSNDEDDHEQSVPPNIPSDAHLSHALQNMSSDEDDCEQSCHLPCTPQKVSYNDQSMESEEDEQAVAVVMHSEDPADFGEVYHASNVDHQPSDNSDNEHSDSDWSTTVRYNLKRQQMAREIRAGNYDLDTHPSTPPLDFPSSEDTVDTEDTGELRKRKGKSTRILPKAPH
ncbi:hypothetical protein M404DRAFT_33307 [Pisolithus tinctorius Marx 270]|uniref:Uncharacterized protein n=1 Tax=Pisolithus tinctorius Marx 270 TaxID=870435 RepID=A0A0C3N5S4_PISTI|nr:hypothetical protein M404DRAFT_33307 [Pisolithus tinctorius Marx 270]